MKILKVINEKVTQDPELEDEEDIDLTATVDDGEDDVVLDSEEDIEDSDEECECDDDTPCDIYADDPVCPCCGAKLNIITDEDDLANGDEDGFANGDEDEEEISDEEVGLDSEEPDTVDLVSMDELPEADDEDSPYYN
jgi:hypothetical protein